MINEEKCGHCGQVFGICGAVHISSDGNKYHLTCPSVPKETNRGGPVAYGTGEIEYEKMD